MLFQSVSKLVDDSGFLDFWIQNPIPEEFDLGMRIYLRVLQISARAKFKKPNKLTC